MSIPLSVPQFQEKTNRTMPRTRVRVDKLIATQGKLDPAKVASIASQPSTATAAPVVHPHRGKYYVSDGHHRVAGAIERGDQYLWVRRVK